jgi:1,4-dihydroxy-6-naphthoate synthase
MESDLADKFIGMYVNDFTRDYGDAGRAAIREFLGQAKKAGYIEKEIELEFVD